MYKWLILYLELLIWKLKNKLIIEKKDKYVQNLQGALEKE